MIMPPLKQMIKITAPQKIMVASHHTHTLKKFPLVDREDGDGNEFLGPMKNPPLSAEDDVIVWGHEVRLASIAN